jgi:RNA polymerase sigma factor (sigma-70 family)
MPKHHDLPPPPFEVPAARHPGVTAAPDAPSAEDIERLFRDHNDALLHFIAAKLGSTQEAREVAQEAYVRLLSLDGRAAISYLRAFLFKTAANLAVDRLRQRARRQTVTVPQLHDAGIVEFSPDLQLEGEQTLKLLSEAIEELPAKCREAFLLYRLDGLSCRDVAQRMGLQERMAWLYISRALEHVRARVYGAAESSGARISHRGKRQ